MPTRVLLLLAVVVGAVVAPQGAGPSAAQAAQDAAPSVVISQIDAGAYPQMRAVVTVLGADGVPAPGLTEANFTAVDGAGAVEVRSAQQVRDTELRLRVLLVVDVSGSMIGAPMAAAQRAATQYVEQLGANDEAALLAFNDELHSVVEFTSDKDELRAGIASLVGYGSTALYDAVEWAAAMAADSGAERRAIVLLSDGLDTVSDATAADSLAAVAGAQAPVFAIGLGPDVDTAYLEQLARDSRGTYFAADEAGVGAVYDRIAELLRSQYVLTMRGAGVADGVAASLRVTVEIDGVRGTSDGVVFERGVVGGADGGGSSAALWVALGVVLLGVIGGGGMFATRRVRASRRQRQREAGAGRVSDEAVPAPPVMAVPVADHVEEVRGRIVLLTGEDAGRAFQFGEAPIVIGSDPEADVRVARSSAVAGRHASVWVRDGKLMLRHTGGPRPTVVAGRQVEWLILEQGDEFAIGPHAFRAELVRPGPGGPAAPTVTGGPSGTVAPTGT